MPGEQGPSKQEPSGIPSQSSPREKDPGSIRRDIPSEKQEILQTSPSPTTDSSGKKDLLKGEQNSKERRVGGSTTKDDNSRDDSRKRNENVGFGLNRIRIEPVIEKRTPGSIGDEVVRSLLRQYNTEGESISIAQNLEKLKELQDTVVDDHEDKTLEKTITKDKTKQSPEKETSDSADMSMELDANKDGLEKRDLRPPLVNDITFPEGQGCQEHRPSHPEVLPPIVMHGIGNDLIRTSLSHLPPNSKISVMSRKTGKVLSGPDAILIKDLPGLLRKDASIELIVPPPGSRGSGFVRNSRTSINATVSDCVRKQDREVASLIKGEFVAVKEGPNTGLIGTFDRMLPGGWSVVQRYPPNIGPKVVVATTCLTREPIPEPAGKKREKRRKISGKELESIFLDSVVKSIESSMSGKVGRGHLDAEAGDKARTNENLMNHLYSEYLDVNDHMRIACGYVKDIFSKEPL